MRNLNIFVKDTVVENVNGEESIIAKKSTNKTMFKVTLVLGGNDLPFIKEVTYTLHKTFKNRIKRIERSISNPDCRLVFYAWGTFTVIAKVETLKGGSFQISHPLQFGTEVQSGKYPIKYT